VKFAEPKVGEAGMLVLPRSVASLTLTVQVPGHRRWPGDGDSGMEIRLPRMSKRRAVAKNPVDEPAQPDGPASLW
jgi:hypothetical protein